MISAKNAAVPGVSVGLGFGQGDELSQQVEAAVLARRKRVNAIANGTPAAFGAQNGFGPTTNPGSGQPPSMISAILGI